jgi:hypothetical protein
MESVEVDISNLDKIWYYLKKLNRIALDRKLDDNELKELKEFIDKLEIANRRFIKDAIALNDFNSDIIGEHYAKQ